MWESGDHFVWGRNGDGHLGFDAVVMSLVG